MCGSLELVGLTMKHFRDGSGTCSIAIERQEISGGDLVSLGPPGGRRVEDVVLGLIAMCVSLYRTVGTCDECGGYSGTARVQSAEIIRGGNVIVTGFRFRESK